MQALGSTAGPQPQVFSDLETFDPFTEPTLSTSAALYGGAPSCPWDPYGNYLCVCLTY
ncbi:MAG TPA: hypothetical protein VFH27_01070 [Longimicrobiaceae bacterium]|nr:hypothetical protein [Longimicrobiaceae bacterium]